MTSPSPFADLLRAIQEGDPYAFAEALRDEHDVLVARAAELLSLSLRVNYEPEDLVQETYLVAYRKLAKTRMGTHEEFRAWMFKVLERRAIDLRRKHFRIKRKADTRCLDEVVGVSEAGTPQHVADLLVSPSDSPQGKAAGEESASILSQVLNSLAPDHREVLTLLRLHLLPIAEVSKRMQRTPAAVHKLAARALQSALAAYQEVVRNGGRSA